MKDDRKIEGEERRSLPAPGERVPRGRCAPPVPPAPDIQRAKRMMERKSSLRRGRCESRIILVPDGRAESRKPLSKWRSGYMVFKRKINSGAFFPLLLLSSISGLAAHTAGISGASLGYFMWRPPCERAIKVAQGISRTNGIQQYLIGWARFHGTGPRTTSDAVVEPEPPLGVEVAPDEILIPQGVADSSVPEEGWLSNVDKASATMGAFVAMGHLFGVAFYTVMIGIMFRLLFRTHFRLDHRVFQPAAKASAGEVLWMTALGAIGYRLAVRYGFNEKLLSTFHPEDFLCQDQNMDLVEKYAYIATGLGCAINAITFLLTWRFGRAADDALTDGLRSKATVIPGVRIRP